MYVVLERKMPPTFSRSIQSEEKGRGRGEGRKIIKKGTKPGILSGVIYNIQPR